MHRLSIVGGMSSPTVPAARRIRAQQVRRVHARRAAARIGGAFALAAVTVVCTLIFVERGRELWWPWIAAGCLVGVMTRLPWLPAVLAGVAVLAGLWFGLWPDAASLIAVSAGVMWVGVATHLGRGFVSLRVLRATRWAVRP
jgi:hypothetical protein